MVRAGSGRIVNISSQVGKFGAPGGATYSATKHAVVGLTEAVRASWRLLGQDSLSYVMPYVVVNTELGAGLSAGTGAGLKNLEPPEVADAIVRALHEERRCGLRAIAPKRSLSRRCCRGGWEDGWKG